MTERTHLRFPLADTLVGYLREFAFDQAVARKIHYNINVTRIRRSKRAETNHAKPKFAHSPFILDLATTVPGCGLDRDGSPTQPAAVQCGVIIMGHGMGVPVRPKNLPDTMAPDGRPTTWTYENVPKGETSRKPFVLRRSVLPTRVGFSPILNSPTSCPGGLA